MFEQFVADQGLFLEIESGFRFWTEKNEENLHKALLMMIDWKVVEPYDSCGERLVISLMETHRHVNCAEFLDLVFHLESVGRADFFQALPDIFMSIAMDPVGFERRKKLAFAMGRFHALHDLAPMFFD